MGIRNSHRVAIAVAFGALVGMAAVAEAGRPPPIAATPISNNSCMDCHGDKTLTSTNRAGKEVSLFVDLGKLAASVHKTNNCVSCHADITSKHPDDGLPAKPANCTGCHSPEAESYTASVHAIALKAGRAGAATCSDCHDGHTILPPTSVDSPLHFSKLAQTCGACHDEAARDVAESVHGKGVAAGHREAPTCTDCHSEHRILGAKTNATLRTAADICSTCHASQKLNTKYNLPSDRVRTFFESYHGLAVQYGSTRAANCASCHGYHRVLPSSDSRSTVHQDHLVATCGKCHPGATENFAGSKVHVDIASGSAASDLGIRVNWWARRIYLGLIIGVIGGMLVHNGLVFARKAALHYRAAGASVERMNLSQRVQHGILALSFIALAVTGFALKFPDSWLARLLGSSEPFRRWSHRIAGVVLLLAGAYHLVYLMATRDGRNLAWDFLPKLKDLRDMTANLGYLFGLKRAKPRFARFGYAEKLEYWAVIWGTIIMGATGLMIWFKMDVTLFLPRWAVDVALTVHYYEAVLACLAILVWHFYHVIFDPDVYPGNSACLNGRVSEHWLAEEHPLAEASPGKRLESVQAEAPGAIALRRDLPGETGSGSNGQAARADFNI